MNQPLVSVVIPVYNVEKYLDRCIKSILSQSYTNIELILVDDGSTDSSGSMCDSWKHNDNRIKVIHKENGGLSDARNAGIRISMGDYITFVDSDDLLHHQALEIMLNVINNTESDLIITELFRFNKEEDISPWKKIEIDSLVKAKSFTNIQSLEILIDNAIGSFIPACGKLYKRYVFDNLVFPVGRLHEDEFIAHRVLSLCKRITYIDVNLYYYFRGNNESICASTMTDKRLSDTVDSYFDRIDFVKEHHPEIYEKALRTLLFKSAFIINKYHKNISKACKKRILKKYRLYTNEAKKICKISPQKDIDIFLCAYSNFSLIIILIHHLYRICKKNLLL